MGWPGRASWFRSASSVSGTPTSPFPLSVSANGRYLQTATGQPFFVHGDSAWSLEVQCTRSQIQTYLDDRKSKGFNVVLSEGFEHKYSLNTPVYRNVEGNDPFTTMSPLDFSTANPAYWGLVKFIADQCLSRGMLYLLCPIYYGFDNTEGWSDALAADTSAHIQAFGAYIATLLLNNPNILYVMGGDNSSGASFYDQFITGMRTVGTGQLITYHPADETDGYSVFGGHTGFTVNAQYTNNQFGSMATVAATAYGRSGPLPFFLIETHYDGEWSTTALQQRVQHYQSLCSGACGALFGNTPVWAMGSNTVSPDDPATNGIGASGVLSGGYLSTTQTLQQAYVLALFNAFAWWKLVPKTDTSLVTTSLGTVASAICPALASDGTFAFIYTPSANFTVAMSAITHGSVVARWYDPSNGTYTTDGASPLANTGTHAFTTPGTNSGGDPDWILVLS